MIKVITGIRRCGKSYLLFKIFKNYLLENGVDNRHIIEIALDGIENEELRDPKKCYQFIKRTVEDEEKYYLFLDEVQLMPRFEEVLNSLLRIENLDVYVTGSNSKFLSSDIVTEFRRRGGRSQNISFILCGVLFMLRRGLRGGLGGISGLWRASAGCAISARTPESGIFEKHSCQCLS